MATQLKDLASIEAILDEMTVEEKASMVVGATGFYAPGCEKYGIPRTLWLDGGTGFNLMQWKMEEAYQNYEKKMAEQGTPVNREDFGGMGGLAVAMTAGDGSPIEKKPVGCYPPGMFFGATWNPAPIEACGVALGKETNMMGVDILLGTPNVNIHRDPLNGRLFEGYSEDPCLVSKLAPAFVKGVMEGGVVADVKHFAANNQETWRMGVDEHISERALREIYLPGFKACVEAGCQTIMSAYNSINGVPCAHNRWLLTDVAKGEWGFDGCIVSDWSAAYDQVDALNAGNDLAMPGPRGIKCIIDAVHSGAIEMAQIDDAVRRFLKVVLQTPAMKGRLQSFDIQEGMEAAEFVAKEGITLLKNADALPLQGAVQVAVYGKRSCDLAGSGAGSAQVDTTLQTHPYDELVKRLGADKVSLGEAKPGTNVWVVTVGANGQEGADRQTMDMDEDDKAALEQAIAEAKAAGGKVVLLLNTCGPLSLMDYQDRVDAIVALLYPGMMGGKVAVDILFGDVNPSGKLPTTWPKYYRDCPTYRNFPGENMEVNYGEGIYVGYRYYDMKHVEPLYPFGYGLSYTTFEISGLQAPASVNVDETSFDVTVRVKNTGKVDGAEVVQLYVHEVAPRFDKPDKELKAFQKVFVKAGETETVTLTLRKEDFASFCAELGQWTVKPGAFELLVGNSSANLVCTVKVQIVCANPFAFGEATGIGEIVADERAVRLINEAINDNILQVANTAVVFMPTWSWKNVWQTFIVPLLRDAGVSEADMQAKWDRLLDEFKKF